MCDHQDTCFKLLHYVLNSWVHYTRVRETTTKFRILRPTKVVLAQLTQELAFDGDGATYSRLIGAKLCSM